MSKILKILSFVGAVLLAIPSGGTSLLAAGLGVGSMVATAIVVGLSVGASLLSPRAKPPANSQENLNRLRASIDPRTPRKTVVGRTALATDIRDEEFTDSQAYFHRFIVVASHKVEAIREIWFDDKLAWSVTGGVAAEFSGYLVVTPVLEGNAGNAINISARMGSSRRYTGLAYVYLRYKLTGNSKKTDSPFAQQITTRITIRGDGANFYDPRKDSTVDGGSGAHRADDQATWEWDDDACRNPALALLFYLLGWQINGELAVGKGVPLSRIDLASFAIAANICDEMVDTETGTEPRYRCDGVWSEGDAPTSVMDMLKACMNADLDDVDGKLRLTVFHDDLADIAAEFTDADVLGDFEWIASPPLDQSFNVVRGVYTDPSNASLYQPVDYPEQRIASPDGIDRIETFDLPMVESPYQAQRLADLRIKRQQFGGTFSAEFQSTAWAVQKNSVIALTFTPRGWTEKLFRVAEMEHRIDGTVPMVLREESAAIYAGPTLAPPVDAVATTTYDPALNPIYQDLTGLSGQIAGLTGSIGVTGDVIGTTNTALMVAVGDVLTVTVGALGNINLSATYTFSVASGAGSYSEYAQWYEETSPGTWTALGTEALSLSPAVPSNFEDGYGEAVHSLTGRTPAASHSFRVYMRNASGTTTRTITGGCYAVSG